MYAASNHVSEVSAPISIVRPVARNTNHLKLVVGKGRLKFATILQRVATNDKAAVTECIDTYGSMVWSMAKRFSASTDEAELVTRDIFNNIWQQAKDYDPSRSDETSFIANIACDRLNMAA